MGTPSLLSKRICSPCLRHALKHERGRSAQRCIAGPWRPANCERFLSSIRLLSPMRFKRTNLCAGALSAEADSAKIAKLDFGRKALSTDQSSFVRQTLDYTAFAASVSGLSHCIPSKVDQVVQWSKSCVAIRLRIPESHRWLHLSWDPVTARMCLGEPPTRGAIAEAFSFGENLHKTLRGMILMDVVMPVPFERVAQLKFGKRQGGDLECSLWCEVMGKYSNLMLTDASKTITACAHQVGSQLSSVRQLQVGGQYVLPPIQSGLVPSLSQPSEEWESSLRRVEEQLNATKKKSKQGVNICAALVRAYQGMSPSLAHDLVRRCVIDPKASATSMSPEDWASLQGEWTTWLSTLDTKDFKPSVCLTSGRFSMLGTYEHAFPDVNAFLDEYYRNIKDTDDHQTIHQQLSSCVKNALNRAETKVHQLEKALADAEAAARTQKQADMIMANVHKWERGSTEISVDDWDTGEAVTIKLDPTKSAVENSQALYKKAKKQRRGKEAVEPLLEEAKNQLHYLREVESSLEQLSNPSDKEDMQALEEIKDELIDMKYMKPPPEQKLAAKAAARSKKARQRKSDTDPSNPSGFRVYMSPNGFRILVGRNSKQNDKLSKQVAKADDLWFHARGFPGSHVVLKLDGRADEPGKEDTVCAAELAAFFSKAGGGGRVPVSQVFGKDVSKPRGAPPGLVQIRNEKTLNVLPKNHTEAGEQ